MLFWAGATPAQTSGLPTPGALRDRRPPSIIRAPLSRLGFGLLTSKRWQRSPERSPARPKIGILFSGLVLFSQRDEAIKRSVGLPCNFEFLYYSRFPRQSACAFSGTYRDLMNALRIVFHFSSMPCALIVLFNFQTLFKILLAWTSC